MARAALWIAVVALLAALAPGCARPTGKGGLARVKASGVLRWGADAQGGEPYVYTDPDRPGVMMGFEVDVAEAIARELGVRAELVQADWAQLVPALERGTFDVALNGVEVTEGRVGRVAFTRPYYVFSERLMVRADDKSMTADLASLRGRKVGTLGGSLGFDMLRGVADVKLYEGVDEPYLDLVRGRIDAVLLDDIIATRYGAPKPGLRVVGDLRDGYYAAAIRPSEPDLRDAIDAALARISKSGELERILTKGRVMDDRQRRLVTWSDADQAAMLKLPPPPPPFGAGHFVLFLKGAAVTFVLSALAMALAVPLGLLLALARLSGAGQLLPSEVPGRGARLLARVASAYVEIYRGTPVLLQLYVLYYGLAPVLDLGPFASAVLGLGMNYAAYEAEAYRAGIQAVPRGQMEAAMALGMRPAVALRRVLLPQALRHALPNVTNDFIALLKDSSLVSVITVVELTKRMTITAVDVRGWLAPGAACALLYFAMSYPLGRVARRLERRLAGEGAPA